MKPAPFSGTRAENPYPELVTEPLHSSASPLVGVVMGSDSDWRVMSDAS